LPFSNLFQGVLYILHSPPSTGLYSPPFFEDCFYLSFKHYCILPFILLQGLYLSSSSIIVFSSSFSFKDDCIYPSSIVFSSPHSPSRILVVSILLALYSLLFNLLQELYLSFKHCILSSSISFKDCIYPSSIVFSPLQSLSRIVSILHAIVFSSPHSPSWIVCIYPSSIIVFSSTTLLQGLFVCILQSIIVFSSPLSFKVLYCPLFHYSPSIKRLCT
jgi:hypothetical protein